MEVNHIDPVPIKTHKDCFPADAVEAVRKILPGSCSEESPDAAGAAHIPSPPPPPPPPSPSSSGGLIHLVQGHPLEALVNRESFFSTHGVNFLDGTGITPDMRVETLGWLFEKNWEIKLSIETVCSAVALFDRFISLSTSTQAQRLRKLVSSCLVVACKVKCNEEAPMDAIVDQCLVSVAEITSIEREIMSVLRQNVDMVTLDEVIDELQYIGIIPFELPQIHGFDMLQAVLVNCMFEYELAEFRPTSVGMSIGVITCRHLGEMKSLFKLAGHCSIDMSEVDACVPILIASLRSSFGTVIAGETGMEIEFVSSSESEDSESEENDSE